MNEPKFVIQVSKGLIRDQRTRRTLMFYTVLGALMMIFAGSTFLQALLDPKEHPIVVLVYWAASAWITLLAVLLALYDLVKVRGAARSERRRLERELSAREEEQKR